MLPVGVPALMRRYFLILRRGRLFWQHRYSQPMDAGGRASEARPHFSGILQGDAAWYPSGQFG